MTDNNIAFDDLIENNSTITKEKDYIKIIEYILMNTQKLCNADCAFFYTITNDFFSLDYTFSESLNLNIKGVDNNKYYENGTISDIKKKKLKSIAETCSITGELSNVDNVYFQNNTDNTFFENVDLTHEYRTVSALTIPLISSRNNIMAVLQLTNARDDLGKTIAFSDKTLESIKSICSFYSTILENRRLKEYYTQLLESFIEVMARAVDAKSPYTGAHCQRVPLIAMLLATAAVEETEGPLKDFEMSEEDMYALHIASWLHDCGKITTPEYIVDKATKLETVNNRIHEIRTRFEIVRRDAHIEYLKKRLNNTESQEALQNEYLAKIKKLEEDFDFVAKCNIGDIPLEDKDRKRLAEISKTQFSRYFSRLKGLSWAELDNIKDHETYDKPNLEYLIQDRSDHFFKNYNYGELYNLSIPRGTITKEEREKINEHIIMTIEILKTLPFPPELSRVIEYAGAHHERIDGKGYPYGLKGNQMSIPAKIMAIADIFEALTANDRPYKKPKKLSEVLKIMKKMRDDGHIDPDLFSVFIKSKVFYDYAVQYISPEQIDEISINDYT